MNAYIGSKIIHGEPMDECTFLEKYKNQYTSNRETQPGYHVLYPDGYHSWSPKAAFEMAYRKISDGEMALIRDTEHND
jgi:hypothetical protein